MSGECGSLQEQPTFKSHSYSWFSPSNLVQPFYCPPGEHLIA